MTDPTVIAIDWSGAKGPGRHGGIWLCAKDSDGELSRGRWARAEVVDYVMSMAAPLVVGFDFSFGLPAWFAREQGCVTIDDVWALAEREADRWLKPTSPFWDSKGTQPEADRRFRRCEDRMRLDRREKPTSVFQLVGPSQVGKGSVLGMPHLARLRAAGFAIWPFDPPGERTVLEIYPTLLRNHSVHHDDGPWTRNDERDAVVPARVMWDERETIAALHAAIDPTHRLEGDIWAPTPPQS